MADEKRESGGRDGGDGGRPASITFAGDVSNEQLGGLRDSTRAEQQARMRVASSAAQQARKVEAERQQSKTKAKDPTRAKAVSRRTDLRTVAQSQTYRRTSNVQRPSPPTQSRGAQAIASYSARQTPAAPSNATHVSRRELGNLRVPTKAQLQSQLNATSYSPEKQQRIAAQWQQTKGRAMNYVQSQNQERTTDLRSVSQNQERTTNLRTVSQAQSRSAGRVSAQTQEKTPTHDGTTVRLRAKKRPEQRFSNTFSKEYQQGKKSNVFERHSPKRGDPVSLKTVAQNLAPTAQQGQSQSAAQSTEKGKQQGKEPAKNVFNKYSPPRDKSPAQQQEKGRSRGR